MKLKTSFFKGITLKKDILRFAPIWALYFIGMMMLIMEMGNYQDYDRYARNFMPDFITAFGIVNLCYAAICANLLFGDLYNTKLCYSLHAMPYRRESWLLTHLLSGLLFSIVPNSLAMLYLMFRLEEYWFLALYWLLATTLQFIFFFGIATVSALLTGNRFAMLLVCAGFNFVSMLLYATVNIIYIPMLVGVITELEPFSRFSPVVQIFQYDYFTFTREDVVIQTPEGPFTDNFYRFDGLADGWGYLAILAGVGLAVMALSFWLYRKRHLESAGDFIAFPKLKGIACVIMTLCVALCFGLVGNLFGGFILWLTVGMVVGFFGSLMLLERRLKVFRKRTFLGFGAMVLAVALSLLATYCDWFGIESWTPKASNVASVTVANTRYNDRYSNGLRTTVEDEYDIQQIITAHEDILTRLDDEYSSYHQVYLTYKMKSGRTVTRYYYVPTTGEGYEIVRRYLHNTANILGFTDAAITAKNITYMYCSIGQINPSMYEKLLCALQADCANGHVSVESDKYAKYFIEYSFTDSEGKDIYRQLNINQAAENVIALLKSPELAMGYTEWAEFLASIQNLHVDDEESHWEIGEADWEGLLTAVRKDLEAGTIQPEKYVSNAILVYYEMRHPNGEYDYREFRVTQNAKYTFTWLAEHVYNQKEEP